MSGRVVKRAYKYRFYPTPGQAGLLNRTFGSVRYVYNRALAERRSPARIWVRRHSMAARSLAEGRVSSSRVVTTAKVAAAVTGATEATEATASRAGRSPS